MRLEPLLFTGDWQLDVASMAAVEQTVDDIIQHARTHKVRCVVHTGDVKDALSPIDGRVTNAMIRAARKLNDAGLTVVCAIGNHDRYATTGGAESWADFLNQLGWHCFEEPGFCDLGGWHLFVAPYAFDVAALKERIALHKPPDASRSIQVFHQGLMGARLSMLRRADAEPLTVADLHPERYRYCIGGHYHAQHCVEANVWYCGSPFCTRWDEANQRKGFLLLKVDGTLVSLPSSLPGWYDPSWPEFPAEIPAGARVRVSVKLESGADPQTAVNREVAKAAKLYAGAEIVPAPLAIEHTTGFADVHIDADDAALVRAYVDATYSNEHPDTQFALREYIARVLASVPGQRRAELKVSLDRITLENFLSFEHLELDYRQPTGLRVVYGINEDRPGHSNGSGKTSLIQAPLAVLFGETLKGQKHDGLKRRGCGKARSFGRLELTISTGQQLVVERSRQPQYVKLWLDGTDISTGKGDNEIKRDIEKLTGLTMEVAEAAMYVDQREVNKLLTGKPAERKAVLAAFLDFERYTKAAEFVKRDMAAHRANAAEWHTYVATVKAQAQSYEDVLVKLQSRRADEAEQHDRDAAEYKAEHDKLIGRKQSLTASLQKLAPKLNKLANDVRVAEAAHKAEAAEVSGFGREAMLVDQAIGQASRKKPTHCATCGAPLKQQNAEAVISELRKQLASIESHRTAALKRMERAKLELSKAQDALEPVERERAKLASAAGVLDYAIAEKAAAFRAALKRAETARQREHGDETEYTRKLSRARRYLRNYEHFAEALAYDESLLQMAARSLSRDGVPAMVSTLLCPRLNASAAHYAHLIADGTIGVNFEMDEDELTVSVHNPTGGESVRDQSAGELRIAALVTTLALLDFMRVNVLFLDEMSLGLDAEAARELARGVSQLKHRFPTIFITSHDPYVLNGLEDYTLIEVRKKDGISRVTTGVCSADREAPEPQSYVPRKSREGRASDARKASTRPTARSECKGRQQPDQVHAKGKR